MPPKPEGLKLSQDAFKNDGGQQKRGDRPERIRLVIGGSAGVKAIDKLTYAFKEQGFGKEKSATKLAGVAYEMAVGEKADAALDSFKIAFESPGNVPVTLIHPLAGAVDPSKLPPHDTPPQFAQLCFSLPTIYKASDVQGDNESKWLELLEVASQRSLTIEIAVAPDEAAREAVEKLLGKAWDKDVAKAKEDGKDGEEAGKKGVRIVFDGFASPPLAQSSDQLPRSKEMQSWNEFVSRLALDPRVYLKLSPLPQPSAVVPTVFGSRRRPADTLGGTVPGANALGQAARAAVDTATQAVQATEAASVTSTSDRHNELQQRLRLFLEPALEAFGEERLVFGSVLSSGSTTVHAIQGSYKDEVAHLSEPEQWFEAVLSSLQEIGVSQQAIDNIFSENVSRVYLM